MQIYIAKASMDPPSHGTMEIKAFISMEALERLQDPKASRNLLTGSPLRDPGRLP
jgi:hypothetical protein